MKQLLLLLLLLCSACARRLPDEGSLRDGDLIFQTSRSTQSRAIQLATGSQWSHCGILYRHEKRWVVLEAVQPVKITPLEEWIARGEQGRYVVKRLRNAERILTSEVLQAMRREGRAMLGKDYDPTFEWSDERIYCSELIWKLYRRATGLEIGRLERLGDFDLSAPAVKQKLSERYGDHIPLDQTVISPVAIFESELLTTVKPNL